MTSVNVTTTKNTVTVNGETRVVTVKTAGPQGTFTDGNLGDVTVSSNGTAIAINTGAVTSAKILDGTIATGDIADDAITSAKIANAAVTTNEIQNLTIINNDISNSAAIAGTKINPNFGSQNIITSGGITTNGVFIIESVFPRIRLVDSDNDSDYDIRNANGQFTITDQTNTQRRFQINNSGGFQFGNGSAASNVDITGNLTIAGTVDGVDIAARDTLFGGLTSSSGVLTNGVTATTQAQSDNSTKVSTTAYVRTAISNLVDSSPDTLNTLNELAAALNDDASFSTTVTNSIATKLPLAGGTLTGDLTINKNNPVITFSDDNNNPDYQVGNINGVLRFQDTTNNATRLQINTDGHVDFLTNVDFAGNITLADNGKIILGDGGETDSFISFDGQHLQIRETSPTGALLLDGHNIFLRNPTQSDEIYLKCNGQSTNRNVELYCQGTQRLETTSTGIDVTGVITGTNHLDLPDDATLKLGDNDEFQIFHRGNDSVSLINEQGGGYLSFGSNGSRIEMYDIANARTMAKFNVGGSCEFKHAADIRLETTSTGISVTGDLIITADTPKIQLIDNNADDDFQISNFSGNFIIKDITNSVDRFTIASDGTTTVANNLNVGAGIDVTGEITGTSHLDLPSDAVLKLGNSDEFQIFHNSPNGNSIIKEIGGGGLSIQSNGNFINFWDSSNGRFFAQFNTNGACQFRHAADIRLETTSTGISVTGDLIITADTPKIQLIDNNADDDFQISNFSGNFIIKDITNSVDRFTIASDGTTTVANNLNVGAGIDVTGDTTTTQFFGAGTTSPAVNFHSFADNTHIGHQIRISQSGTGDAVLGWELTGVRAWSAGIDNSDSNRWKLSSGSSVDSNTQLTIEQDGFVGLHYDSAATPKLATTATGVTVDGRIGVGTDSASFPVHVFNDDTETNNQVRIEQDGTGDAVLGFALTGTRAYSLGIDNSDSDKFKISTATNLHTNTLFTIDGANQRVGINQASPDSALDVSGQIRSFSTTGTTDSGIKVSTANESAHLYLQNANTNANFNISYGGSGGADISITHDGIVKLFNGGGTTAKLETTATGVDVNGRITSTVSAANTLMLNCIANMGTHNDRPFRLRSPATDSLTVPFTIETFNALEVHIDGNKTLNIDASGQINLHHAGSSTAKLFTDATGIGVNGNIVATGDGTFDDIRIGEWSHATNFGGVFHKDHTGQEYMIINNGSAGSGHTYISAGTGHSVFIRGGGNNQSNVIEVDPSTGINLTAANSVNLDGILDFSGASSSPYILMKAVSQRVKYILWNSINFGIGMTAGVSYGSIGNDQNDNTQFATTFQMNDINDRGWIFLDSSHTLAQGAMSLTTQGKMTVAHSMRLGYGESDTTESGATHALDVNGSISSTSTISATTSAAIGDTNLRKITTSTSAPTSSDGGVGDIWIVYPS